MELNLTLEHLIKLLKQETALYRSMHGIVDREKEAAVRSDLDAFNGIEIEKKKILNEIKTKEDMRHQLLTGLAQTLGHDIQDFTLTKIIALVDEPLAESLRRVKQDMSAVVTRLQAANLRNQQLIEHSLGLIKGSINLFEELLRPHPVYYRTGNIRNPKSTGKCVSSEI
jgi:flagellar biosynthesis/type III secretory pathway chaperone